MEYKGRYLVNVRTCRIHDVLNRTKRCKLDAMQQVNAVFFDTLEEAAIAHNKAKKKAVIEVANEYKDKIPDKVYQALINWIPDYIDYSE